MAQKRMFDKRVVDTDKFIDLPNSTKALYFMAGMSADDKGFFQPRKLQKICGFTDDDFKILIAKNYFIVFESGVMVVTDWNKNNWLDSRRISETEYVDELNLLKLVNEKYEFKECGLANAKQMLSENSIEENSIVYIYNNSVPKKFQKPTVEEVKKYCEERKNGVNAEKFVDYYDSIGWLVGKKPMKDWKACVRTWEKKEKEVKVSKSDISTPDWFNKKIEKKQDNLEELEDILNDFGG